MARQQKVGMSILAFTTVNAFVPYENRALISRSVSSYDRRRSLSSRLGYSNNNVDENSRKDLFNTTERTNPASLSVDQMEFLFHEESVNLNEISSPPIEFDSKPSEPADVSDANAQAILAENASLLSTGGSDSVENRFNFDMNINENSVTDNTEDVLINEDLKAVLTASGEAAAAAEASMSPELVEVLDELAIEALNVTTQNTDMGEVEVPSPIPTIAAISSPIINTEEHEQESLIIPIVEELSRSKDDSGINFLPSTSSDDISTPNVGKILKFAIPAIGVWLCSPILSLIDTSAVGVLSGTVQQAALNPAVAVTDYAALLIAFLYTGTTNMVASAQESDRGTSDMPLTAKMMVGAMRMSTYVGVGLGAFLFAFARPLLSAIIGNGGISPAVFAAAMKYVRIRALGMPAAAILGSTQAACLGMQDIKSPLYVLGAAAMINLFGDIIFVGHSNPLIGGTAGAAWATVLSQYAAVAFFLKWLCNKGIEKSIKKPPEVMNLSNAILEMTSKSEIEDENGRSRRQSFRKALDSFKTNSRRAKKSPTTQPKNKLLMQKIQNYRMGRPIQRREKDGNRDEANTSTTSSSSFRSVSDTSFSTRGFLNSRFSTTDILKPPDKDTREKFAPYVVPVTTTQVGRVSGYVAMAHVVASSLGTVSMAAQQVIVSIFYCLCPIADSLSLTAQSFVPAISEKEASMGKAAAMKKLLLNFLKAGAVFGGSMMAAVCGIPLLAGFFTSDQAVINLVNSVVPLLLVFFGVHGFVCATEGILLGQKDLGYLGKMYASFFAAVPYLMLGVKKKALAGCKSVGLTSVWTVFIGYQLARCGLWLTRTAILQRRTSIEAKRAVPTDMNDVLAP